VSGPDLSLAGSGGFDADWYVRHLAHRDSAASGPWRSSMSEIAAPDRAALDVFLHSRVGAPGLVAAKVAFHSLGCRGCHKVGGVGGDDGPDLTRVGEKDPGQLDFTHVPGTPTLANWFAEHFRAPGRVVPGSAMPVLGLAAEDIEKLTYYMLSLRRSDLPAAFWPLDRVRAERFGEREFATDGATLYGTFCAACHGPEGQGMRYAETTAFPAIGTADFLGLATDDFITATVRRGRPGRRMPAWGEGAGGLRPEEIQAVVAHVRGMGGVPEPVDSRPARWVTADPEAGAHLFLANCARCHGEAGEGGEGPALHNPVLLSTATDAYLIETIRRGRRSTTMPPFATPSTTWRLLTDPEIESIVAFIRTWEVRP
jgi:cytochrome c oxidase cbb3-type subunit 3